ncbi:MAG: serine/threonine protein kinase, partial [Sandaracinaceae bacterium]|nr:serine/threonine protein kinase [Sandaracinaceae bacterium]
MAEASLPNVLAQRFQVSDRIASGQAGPTYRVTELATQRRGALKVIEAARAWTAAERGRLGRELEKLATLKHPYLAEVYATGIADDLPWVFRAEIEGESLRAKIEASRASGQPYAQALHVIAQLSAALDEVHRAGLLQRDLSPEHVLVRPDGSVSLIDTGVAMRIASASVFEIAGKPAYVSPEHATGKLVSFRSDLYALGCMLFEMLTGAPPFVGTPDQVLEAHRQKPAPALEGQPQPVTALVAQLLQKDPRDRPFSAQQVRRTLEPLTGALPVPQSKPQGGGTLLGLAAVSAPQQPPRADATEQLSALDLAKVALAPAPPPPKPAPRADGTEQLSALDLARAETLIASNASTSNASTDGSSMTQNQTRQSVPPPVPGQAKRSVPPPPPPRASMPGGTATSGSGQMAAQGVLPPQGAQVPPPPPPAAPVKSPSSAELDYDDFAETKAVSRDMVNELRALGGLESIDPATAQAAQAPAAAQQGFGAPQQGFGAPQQGFGAPQQNQQGFGAAPAQGGFGAPAAQAAPGGFGAPAQGGFGAPGQAAQGGFGAPAAQAAQGGFGAPGQAAQGGFGAPAQGGFGA